MAWFDAPEQDSNPVALYARQHPDSSAPRRTPVTHPIFGPGLAVGELEDSPLGKLIHVVFDSLDNQGKNIEGAFLSSFLTVAS